MTFHVWRLKNENTIKSGVKISSLDALDAEETQHGGMRIFFLNQLTAIKFTPELTPGIVGALSTGGISLTKAMMTNSQGTLCYRLNPV